MNRLLCVCVALGLCLVGCSKTSDSVNQTVNKSTNVVSTITSPTPAAKSNSNSDATSEKMPDITGGYFMAEPVPAQFSEIEHLSLATVDDQGNPSSLNGFIRPKRRADADYKLVNPKITGKDLTFTTSTVGGTGYSFKGTFEKLADFSTNAPDPDEVVLKGTLTKLKDGAEIGSTKVNFTYSAGG